MIHVRFITLR